MNISTQTVFYIFFAQAAVLVLVLVINRVRRRRQRSQEEALLHEAEFEDALRKSPPGTPAASVALQATSGASESIVGAASDDAASATNAAGRETVAQSVAGSMGYSVEEATRPSVIRPDQFMAWAPPNVEVWQPSTDVNENVSWTSNELFRARVNDFDEPNDIPKLLPGQVPVTDSSDYMFGSATSAMAGVMPAADVDRTNKELARAGFHQPHAMQNLQAVRFIVLFVVLFFGGVALILSPPQFELWVVGGTLCTAALLWSVPRLYLQNKATERTSQLERAMPDMLDMLNMCVSQGLTIPSSLKRISRDLKPVYPALAQELTIVVHQAEVGNMQISLDNFADRVDVPEVDSFVSLLNQSERMGTNVSSALTEYSNTMRESLRQRTDEKANQAAFRLMFPTVLFMMPAVFGFLMGPAIVELQDFFDEGGMEAVRGDANLGDMSRGFQRAR
jgi:tight adherence protein C